MQNKIRIKTKSEFKNQNRLLRYFSIGILMVLIIAASFSALSIFILYNTIPFDINKFVNYDEPLGIYDRHGNILYQFSDEKGERYNSLPVDKIPTYAKNAFLAAEDGRFYQHHGFDIWAILRAAFNNLKEGEIVSGASTITQQLVRQNYPHKRSYWQKIIEILRSTKLETKVSKDKILRQYLNKVPMGNNIRGIQEASRLYFGKSISNLSIAEVALLAALPKAPGYFNPYGNNKINLLIRKNWVLKRMKKLGFITPKQYLTAIKLPIHFVPFKHTFRAPHFVNLVRKRFPNTNGRFISTIDLNLQRQIEAILLSNRERLAYHGAHQASCIIVHNPTHEVLAYAGSIKYASRDQGFNDGIQALRSAGSTLKPFLYCLALEEGFSAANLLADTQKRYSAPKGEYLPANFDRNDYGPITLRQALGNSLNLSAIKLLNKIGYSEFYSKLKQINLINNLKHGPDYYGLGLVVGNPEVTLEELVSAYSMLANKGKFAKLKFKLNSNTKQVQFHKIYSREATAIISDILSDPTARSLTFGGVNVFNFPYSISLKTGTSTNYRDSWTLGYTDDYTIGVWVGNFDGSPTYRLCGATGAGPIFAQIIQTLYRYNAPSKTDIPNTLIRKKICAYSGMKPSPFCTHIIEELFIKGTEPTKICTFHNHNSIKQQIPVTYANWLYKRNINGIKGAFYLEGSSPNKNQTFDNPWKNNVTPDIIRVKNTDISNSKSNEYAHSKKIKQIPAIIHIQPFKPDFLKSFPLITSNKKQPLKIIYPLNGDRFLITDNETENTITFKAVTTIPTPTITWFINRVEYAKTSIPYQICWHPTKGNFKLIASLPNGLADEIYFSVE